MFLTVALAAAQTSAASVGPSVSGVVRDAAGAVLPGATVELIQPGTGSVITTVTDVAGQFDVRPPRAGRYRLRVTFPGFDPYDDAITIGDIGAPAHSIRLLVARVQERVLVEAPLVDVTPGAQVRVDRHLIETLPSESVSAGLSSFITLTSPGVATDSNGVFHPLGEHAETSFTIDDQPISDQQSRIFSNQLSPNAIESMEISTGVPPAEFGDKTSLVASVTTRSGMGLRRLAGTTSVGFGSFQTPTVSMTLGRGGTRSGNFLAVDGTASRRFLDTPEPEPLHARGHVINLFDRFDVQPSSRTTFHINVIAAQSGFQTPNTNDQQAAGQDQRQRQDSIDVASSLTHALAAAGIVEISGWLRRDHIDYNGSANPFADRPAALGQHRGLSNAGAKTTFSGVAGRHDLKGGLQASMTRLAEEFQTGITDSAFNAPCFSAGGDPSPDSSLRDPSACREIGLTPNPGFLPGLLPFDLMRGGSLFTFDGKARVVQWAGWLQDSVKIGQVTAMVGTRLDLYDGMSHGLGVQPRLGVTYRADRTKTVWRIGYGRIFLTPYNENLVLASSTGGGGLGNGLLGSVGAAPLTPGRRNQYDVGLQQQVWLRVKVDADYFWKLTNGPYDFDVILNTPLTFPVQFRKSKINGGLVRVSLPDLHGVQVYATLSHTGSRLFGPELGGLRFSAGYSPVARPDHDEPFQSTMHVEYRRTGFGGFWTAATWRYDSGLVAVSVPTYSDALRLTGDQQAAMGLYCGAVGATVARPIRICDAQTFGATRIRIPPRGTENDDTNPPRIAPHHVVDLGIGFDRLKPRGLPLGARVTIVNVANTTALYNFLSTFAGTHFVTPRTIQAELTVRFGS
jgi:hypothetical protein